MSMQFYASDFLERAAERRSDEEWLAARIVAPQTRVVPVFQERSLVASGEPPRAVVLAPEDLGGFDASEAIFLGVDQEDRAHFTIEVGSGRAALVAEQRTEFIDLRRIGSLMDAREAGLLAYARAMTYWHRTHRFCGRCGCPTIVGDSGWLRRCAADGCEQPHFPRTDPAIIVRVLHEDRILLGRQAAWPPRWYSVLAGFVEPGESLEETVRREVAEESGVRVSKVRYQGSQPWPFPSSLMLGFCAEAESERLDLSGEELVDARWMTRRQVHDEVAGGTLRLSPPQSISRRLIDDWLLNGNAGASD